MYSHASVAVDKGLGFDFSEITNLVKSALPVGLNIFQKQMELKQVKAMAQSPYMLPVQGLPAAQMYGMTPQPNMSGQYYPQQSGIGTGTIMAVGAAVVAGVLAFKLLR